MQKMDTALRSDPPEIEYLDGTPYPKVSPRSRHAAVQGALLRILHACAGNRGLVGPELRVYPGAAARTQTSLVPDVAFVSRERLLSLPDAGERQRLPFSPDVVAEVRSPADDPAFLRRKIARYLQTGAQLVLDVDPERRRLIAHAADGSRAYEAGEHFTHAAAPWLNFNLAELFADLDRFGL